MKLHLPKPLRNSVLACIAAVAGIATPTLGTATFAGGVVAFTLASQQAAAEIVTVTSQKNVSEVKTDSVTGIQVDEGGVLTMDANVGLADGLIINDGGIVETSRNPVTNTTPITVNAGGCFKLHAMDSLGWSDNDGVNNGTILLQGEQGKVAQMLLGARQTMSKAISMHGYATIGNENNEGMLDMWKGGSFHIAGVANKVDSNIKHRISFTTQMTANAEFELLGNLTGTTNVTFQLADGEEAGSKAALVRLGDSSEDTIQAGTLTLNGITNATVGGTLTVTTLEVSNSSLTLAGATSTVSNMNITSTASVALNNTNLTVNGVLTLADGATLSNNGTSTIAFGANGSLNLSELTAVDGAGGAKVYTILTGTGSKDLSFMTEANLSGVVTMGRTWTFGTDGTISYVETTKDVVWDGTSGSDITWATSGTQFSTGGEFANGDSVTFAASADVAIATGGVEAMQVTIEGEGTYVKFTGGQAVSLEKGLTVGKGATLELVSNVDNGSTGLLRGEVTVQDGGKLLFIAKDMTGWNSNCTETINILSGGTLELHHGANNNETFRGVLNLDGTMEGKNGAARWDLFGGNAAINVAAGANAVMDNVSLCIRQANGVVTVGNDGTLTITNGVVTAAGETHAAILVKQGAGALIVQGESNNGGFTVNGGSVEMNNDSERTMTISGAAGTSFTKNGAGVINMGSINNYSYAGTLIVNEGVLKFTTESGESAVEQPGFVRLYRNLVTKEDSKAVVEGDVVFNYRAQDAQSCTSTLNGNLEVTGNLNFNSYGSGNAPDGDSMRRWNIESDGALTVGGTFSLTNNQKMVISGGALQATGGIALGHAENGPNGAYKAKLQLDSGSVTTAGIVFRGGHNIVEMKSGELELTAADAFTGGADNDTNKINLLGGTLKISTSDVNLTGSSQHNLTMGGIDIDVASGKTATLGGAINLSGTIEKVGTGTLKLDNGLVLSVDNLGAFDRGEGATYTDFNGSTTSGNGFFSGSILLIAGDYNKAGSITVQVGGTAVTNYVEDSTGLGVSVTDNSTYFVNTGTVTLTESKAVSAFYIASGAVLAYEAGDFTATLSGTGTYRPASVMQATGGAAYMTPGITLASDWTGIVEICNSQIMGVNFNSLGTAQSSVKVNGLGTWIHTSHKNIVTNLILENYSEERSALIITDSSQNNEYIFNGSVSGTGDFEMATRAGSACVFTFNGDTSKWSGDIFASGSFNGDPYTDKTKNTTPNFTVKLTGAGDVFDPTGDSTITMNRAGIMYLQLGNATEDSTLNATIAKNAGNIEITVNHGGSKTTVAKAVNATKLTVNGYGEFLENVTLSDNIAFSGNQTNHLVLHGQNNIANVIDLSNSNAAVGVLELKKGATVTSRGALWMRPDASILLEEGASVIWDDTKVTGKAGSVAEIKASANAAQRMDIAGLQVKDALFEVSKNETRTVAALLQNSSIINSGTALVTVTNAANTLTGVEAKAGNILVQNATTGRPVTLGAVVAADAMSVTAEMAQAQVSAITLGAGATFTTNGALELADGAAIVMGEDSSIAMNGALTLGTDMVLTMGELHLGDNVIMTGVTSLTGITDEVAASAVFSSITGVTNIDDFKLKVSNGSLVLVNASSQNLTWDVQYDTWANGEEFATVEGAAVNFKNNDIATFGTLSEDETVTIHSDGVAALSVTIDAGSDKSYSFSGGQLTTGSLTVSSGTAVFGGNTLNLGALSSVVLAEGSVLDLSAYNVGESFATIAGLASGDGTVKYSGNDIRNGNDEKSWRASLTGGLVLNTAVEVTKSLAINAYAIGDKSTATVVSKKGLSVGGELRLESDAKLVVDNSTAEIGTISLCHIDSGQDYPGHVYVTGADASLKTSGIILSKTIANTASSFTMDSGKLEITSGTGIAAGIVTNITGGTLVADAASWGIKGATIGGATVTTSGDNVITLTDTTLTDKLTVEAGTLKLAGSVDINPTGDFGAQAVGEPRYYAVGSDTPTDNGFRFTTTVYTLVAGDGALDATAVTSWKLDGTALSAADYTYANKQLTVNAADGTLYWANTGTVNYGGTDAADMTGATGIALNGGTIQLNASLQEGWSIERKASGTINLNGTDVTLTSDQVTGTVLATIVGNGVYDIGNTALGTGPVVNAVKVTGLKEAAWSGTVVVKDSVGNANKLGLNELGNANSTVKLVNTQGYLWNGSGSNTLASVDTNVILADSDNDYNAALTIANGSSKSELVNEGHVMSTFTKKVSGTGNMAFSWTTGYTGLAFTGDVSEWTGAFIVTAENDTGNGHVNLKFSGDANVIKADLKRSAADRQQLMVYLDDAGATDTTAGITMHGSIEATKLTLGLADDTADSRAKVNLNNSVTVDTLANYAAATLAGDQNLTVDTLTNAGTLTVNGTLVDGAAVTNNGTLELTQAAATLASLAGTGTVTAKSLTLTGAATDSNSIEATSLTLQAATNTVGALNLGSLTLGANVTSLTAGELNISGDVVVSKVAANFLTSTTGLATGSKLNLNIDETLLQDYMSAANTNSVQLATVTGLSLDLVTLNKDTTGWSATDYTLTTSDDQYTYALDVDANGVLTLTRATNGIIWNGDAGEKWVMDDETVSWKTKGENPVEQTYGTVAQSTIFNGSGEYEVVVSGAVTTTNVTFDVKDADIDGYTFTDDAETATADLLNIEKNLSINGGELKLEVNTQVGGRTEVGATGKLTLATPQNSIMAIGSGLSNRGELNVAEGAVVMVGDAITASESVAITNAGTMTNAGQLLVSGMLTNTQQLTNSGQLMVGMDATNTGILTNTAGQFGVTGNLTNGAVGEDATNAELVVSGGQLTIGGQLVNNATGKVSISGDETMVGVGNDDIDVAVDNAGNININGGTTTITGAVANTGSIAVTGGSLSTGDVDNDGTLSVAGGSMTVTGDLDNTDGTLTLGSDDATGSLKVTGSLTHAGNSNIEVNSGSSLDVTGDLAADGMELGFDGTVTVGGYAEVDNLTINEGASFTANEAEIGTLANNGTLSVGEVDAEGKLIGGDLSIGELTGSGAVIVGNGGELDIDTMDGSGSVTVGNNGALNITTLNGTGNVAVGEGGTLYIENDATFTGTVDNKGTVATDNKLTLTQQTSAGGTVSAADLVVTQAANGSSFTAVTTNSITIESLATDGSVHLTTGALAGKIGNSVELVLSQLTTAEGMADIIATGEHTYNLLSIGGTAPGLTMAELDAALEQQLWKSGLKLGDLETASTMALRASSTNVSISVLEQSITDATWDTAGETTIIGLELGTLSNGTMVLKSNDMLDNVQSVNVTKDVKLDLGSDDAAAVNIHGLTGKKNLSIAGNGDEVKVDALAGGYDGTLSLDNVKATVSGELGTVKLTNKTVADLTVSDTDVDVLAGNVTLNGTMTGGELTMGMSGVKGVLKIDGTDLNIVYDDQGKLTMDTTGVSATGHVLVKMSQVKGDEGDIFIGKDGVASKLMDKYFTNVRFEEKQGVVADRNTVYYTSKLTDSASTDNGKAGLAMADESLLSYNPQNTNPTGDLAKVLEKLDEYVAKGNKAAADELGASLAGASTAVLGMAAMGDVDRQLRAIRNRTTTMGVDQSVVNADMPYFNAWINAEGDSREMGEDETLGGYKLNSYGGTVGFDVDIEPTLTAGMALTAMYGDLDATGADKATGNLDSYYVSAFARYCGSAWTHTFVGTIGMGDISLDRTVADAQVKGETDSMSFGLMYEVGRVYAMDEDGTTCLQPVFNVTWKHTTVDAYTEKGGDVALSVDEQSLNTITFGLGARLQTVVGESMYNRTSIFECRLLAKADAGDTEGTSKVALGSSASHEVKSNEMGAIGIEVGAGLTIPLGDEGSSIFMDASAEIRADYTDVNGTVGYRVNF